MIPSLILRTKSVPSLGDGSCFMGSVFVPQFWDKFRTQFGGRFASKKIQFSCFFLFFLEFLEFLGREMYPTLETEICANFGVAARTCPRLGSLLLAYIQPAVAPWVRVRTLCFQVYAFLIAISPPSPFPLALFRGSSTQRPTFAEWASFRF